MARAIGIDFGTRACKVAVVDGGAKGAKLVRFAEVEYPVGAGGAPTQETILAGLKKALADARGPRSAASYAMAAEQLVLREITVPFTQDEQIRKVVKFEFEPHMHQGAIEDVVLDFIKTGAANLGPGKTGSRLLVLAASKEVLRARLDQLKHAGVDPLHVDVDVAALFNVATQCGAFIKHPNCLVIDIGARTTKALAIRDGKLRVARSIRIGARGALRELEAKFEGDSAAAKRALESSSAAGELTSALGSPADPSTLDIVTSVHEVEAAVARAVQDDFLGRVLRETTRTLPATSEGTPITCVWLTGGGASHRHARERIAAHFGVEVRDLPILDELDHGLSPTEAAPIAATGAVAIGTALKVLGVDHGGVDLRKEEFRFSRTFDRVKVAAATAVTLGFFAIFLHFLTGFLGMQQAKKELAALRTTTQDELSPEFYKKYEEKVPNARMSQAPPADAGAAIRQSKSHLEQVHKHLKTELGLTTEVPPIRSSLEPMTFVARAISETRAQIPYLLIKDEKYLQDRADVLLVVNSDTDAEKVKVKLEEYKDIVKTAATRNPKRDPKSGKYEVTIALEFHDKLTEAEAKEESK